jgi:hypothetical protein
MDVRHVNIEGHASAPSSGRAGGAVVPDLNISVDYFDHPKVKRLIGLLGRGAEVLPLKVWAYTAKVRPKDGRLVAHAAQEIESIAGWWGNRGEMVRVMLLEGTRFLERESDGTYVVHDWLEHQGHLAAFHDRAKNAAKIRWQRIRDPDGSNASGMPQACLEQSPRPTESKNSSRSRVSGYTKPPPPDAALAPAAVSLRSELTAAGIGEPSLSRCAAVPGLTPVAVLLMAQEAEKEADENPAGWMVSRILAANFKPLELVQRGDGSNRQRRRCALHLRTSDRWQGDIQQSLDRNWPRARTDQLGSAPRRSDRINA